LQLASASVEFGDIAGRELRALHFDRTARLDDMRRVHLRCLECVTENLREHMRVDRLQSRPATAFDFQDAERGQRPVRLAHAAAADLELLADLHFARDQVAGAQARALDQVEQVARDLGR